MKKVVKHMQIVLVKDIPNLGEIGEIKNVKPGYARNYLIPGKLAAFPGSPEAKKILLEIKVRRKEKEQKMVLKAEEKVKQKIKRETANARKVKLLRKK